MTISSKNGITLFHVSVISSHGLYSPGLAKTLLIKARIPCLKYSKFLPFFKRIYLSNKIIVFNQVLYADSYWWHIIPHRIFFGHNNKSYVFFHAYRFHIGYSYTSKYIQIALNPLSKVIRFRN